MHALSTRRWDGKDAAAQLDALLPAYEEIYSEPPYREGPREVAEFIESFAHQVASRPGFRLVLAHDGDQVVGFTYGYFLPASSTWWRGLLAPQPEEFTNEDGHRTFAIIELAVRKSYRRRGIAHRMHTALLAGVTAERVALNVRPEPEAAPAQHAYAHWGYQLVGDTRPWDEAPLYQSLLLPLAHSQPAPPVIR
ncbi:GNAT family N-acetyltransferase [Streptomyces sp. T-3]|nr:GNAT family N-acetyltransferase [Streptomyces sp. T-3]